MSIFSAVQMYGYIAYHGLLFLFIFLPKLINKLRLIILYILIYPILDVAFFMIPKEWDILRYLIFVL